MNRLPSSKCAGRVFMALAVIASVALIVSCGSSGLIHSLGGGFSKASLKGQYVISQTGIGANQQQSCCDAFSETIVFTADGSGNVTVTADDFDQVGGPFNLTASETGTYRVASDGTGSLSFGGSNYAITMIDDNHFYIIEQDFFATASGFGEKQDTTAFTAAPSGTFRTAEGLLNIAANETYQYEKLCDLIGRPELKTDPRFSDREIRKQNRAAINKEVEAALATRSAAEWESLMIDAGVPAGRVLSVPEILSNPHLTRRRFVTTFEAPRGTQRVTRGGFAFSDNPAVPSGPAPLLSEHTDAWLRKLGYDAGQILQLQNAGVI